MKAIVQGTKLQGQEDRQYSANLQPKFLNFAFL